VIGNAKASAALIVFGGVLTFTVAAAALSSTGSTSGTGRAAVNHVAYQWRHGSETTTSNDWTALRIYGPETGPPGTGASNVLHATTRGAGTLTLSVDLRGGAVDFRILDNGKVARPGPASFAPGVGDTSRSFTFLSRGTAKARCHQIVVQWRSSNGESATVTRSALAWTYQAAAKSLC
jgi:hypothetical protein